MEFADSTINGVLINGDKENSIRNEEYMNYIQNHISNVKKAFNRFFKDSFIQFEGFSDEEMEEFLSQMESIIENHDMSKYSDEEFYGYRLYFYPTSMEKDIIRQNPEAKEMADEEYEKAWDHHRRNNSHHPSFYLYNDVLIVGNFVLRTTPLATPKTTPSDMALSDIIEMFCDWAAMSKDEDFNFINWYTSNKSIDERNDMTANSKIELEKIIMKVWPEEYKVSDSDVWLLKKK